MPAAEFAIGDRLQSGIFLQRNRIANGRVLDHAQRHGAEVTVFRFNAGIAQRDRPQEAADMVGPKWRFWLVAHYCSRPGISSSERHTSPSAAA